MYPAICTYDDQAFNNMSEESEEKNNFVMNKSLRPVPSQGMVEQAKKHMAASDPSSVTQEFAEDPRE